MSAPHPSGPPPEPSYTRRNLVVGLSTLSVAVLAWGYHAGLDAQPAGSLASAGEPSAGGAAPTAAAATTRAAAAPTAGATGGALKDGTYTGAAVSTRWGPVQVRIRVSGGRIASSQAVVYPQENDRDQRINARAIPAYDAAAVAAQSADIDAVSGATVTWTGYTGSLQSALDAARA